MMLETVTKVTDAVLSFATVRIPRWPATTPPVFRVAIEAASVPPEAAFACLTFRCPTVPLPKGWDSGTVADFAGQTLGQQLDSRPESLGSTDY